MKPVVDEVLCEGYARCMATVPSVFRVDEEEDVSKVLVEQVDASLRAAVVEAVRLCPRQAISIQE
jgi:ferredoxin